jgi:glycosyltransferase involved in cell wall biosynthesis
MKVNFLLPGISSVAIGGYKVVYEYANKLSRDGFEVHIIYPLRADYEKVTSKGFFYRFRISLSLFFKRLTTNFSGKQWFTLHNNIVEHWVPYLSQKNVPDAYATVASAWQTAEWLNTYPSKKGKKLYLIQHYEDWNGPKNKVDATWQMPLQKLVISRWLQDYATSLHQPSTIVNNGLDFEKFNLDNPIEKRDACKIIMLYHHLIWKGSKDGIKALEIAKEKNNDVQAILFGNDAKPTDLPSWIEYHQSPKNLRELYNSASIFISPSLGEGWALPPAEAMQCGCAAILTNIGGHKDYGEEDKELLFVPVSEPQKMAEKILELCVNTEKRMAIANAGHQNIKRFTWDNAYQKFKTILLQ